MALDLPARQKKGGWKGLPCCKAQGGSPNRRGSGALRIPNWLFVHRHPKGIDKKKKSNLTKRNTCLGPRTAPPFFPTQLLRKKGPFNSTKSHSFYEKIPQKPPETIDILRGGKGYGTSKAGPWAFPLVAPLWVVAKRWCWTYQWGQRFFFRRDLLGFTAGLNHTTVTCSAPPLGMWRGSRWVSDHRIELRSWAPMEGICGRDRWKQSIKGDPPDLFIARYALVDTQLPQNIKYQYIGR